MTDEVETPIYLRLHFNAETCPECGVPREPGMCPVCGTKIGAPNKDEIAAARRGALLPLLDEARELVPEFAKPPDPVVPVSIDQLVESAIDLGLIGRCPFYPSQVRFVETLVPRAKEKRRRAAGHNPSMPAPLIEFPADDPDRARRFWHGVLGVTLAPRSAAFGSGWQTDTDGLRLGVHERGPGPGDTASLPYFTVADLAMTLERVRELGGSVIHPGDRWAVCRDSEGSPFALAAAPATGE